MSWRDWKVTRHLVLMTLPTVTIYHQNGLSEFPNLFGGRKKHQANNLRDFFWLREEKWHIRSTVSKVAQMIILTKVFHSIERVLRENRNRSYSNQLSILRTLIQNCFECNLPLIFDFIDFWAAFNSVHRGYMRLILSWFGLLQKYINIYKVLYSNTVCTVRGGLKLNDCFMWAMEQNRILSKPYLRLILFWTGNIIEN